MKLTCLLFGHAAPVFDWSLMRGPDGLTEAHGALRTRCPRCDTILSTGFDSTCQTTGYHVTQPGDPTRHHLRSASLIADGFDHYTPAELLATWPAIVAAGKTDVPQ